MDVRTHRVADLAAAVRSGQVTARELVEVALRRIEALDPGLNAFVAVDGERALVEADAVDRRVRRGRMVVPLAGIPLAVKDLEDAAGFPTRYGSVLSSAEPATTDSVLVSRLRAAGCVVIGKTTTPEYGHKGTTNSPLTGATRNPWAPDRDPGGSSGGSAVAVASGMVSLATGSDGGGSIRIPSALCGLSGIKTTQGRVPNGGANPPGSGLLAVKGPMARRIDDVAIALDACVGPDPTDPFTLPRPGTSWYGALASARLPDRVVWAPTLGYARVDREIATICQAAVDRLAASGTEVTEVATVWDEDPVTPWLTMWAASRARTQGHLLGTPDYARIDESLRFHIEWGLGLSAADMAVAIDAVHLLNLRLEDVLGQAPVLLTPTLAGQAPLVGHDGTIDGVETNGWVGFTHGFNLTRNPAGTVNVGITQDGVPVGLQVVARQRADLLVLRTIRALEELYGSCDQLAPVDQADTPTPG